MPKLGEYLGLILSEFTRARMIADLESVRIAKIYAGDSLLRNMPIPHFRLPNIEVDMPVVINRTDELGSEEAVPTVNNLPELEKTFEKALSRLLRAKRINVTPAHMRKIKSAIEMRIDVLKLPKDVPLDIGQVAENFADTASLLLEENGYPIGDEDTIREKKFKVELKGATMKEFLKSYKPLPRLHILSKTSEVRDAGPDEVVTRIRLKISEEGFEIIKIETEGESKEILVPE